MSDTYFIFTGKSPKIYNKMFIELISFGDEHAIQLEPHSILYVREKAVIKTVTIPLQKSATKL